MEGVVVLRGLFVKGYLLIERCYFAFSKYLPSMVSTTIF